MSKFLNVKGFPTKQFEEKRIRSENVILDQARNQQLKDVLKDQISQAMVKNNEVWLLECDELKNYKFYFPSYNASTLAYLNKKNASNSLFS